MKKRRQSLDPVGGFGAVGIVLVLVVLLSGGLLSSQVMELAIIGAVICAVLILNILSRQNGYVSVFHELAYRTMLTCFGIASSAVLLVIFIADLSTSKLSRLVFATVGVHILALGVLNPFAFGVVPRVFLFLISVFCLAISYAIHARLRYIASTRLRA